MGAWESRQKRLIVERTQCESRVLERLGHDGAIDLASSEHVKEFVGEIFLQHERHLRRQIDHVFHKLWQQIRANGVDDSQSQLTRQGIFATLGNFFDVGSLLEHTLGLAHNFLAQGGRCHLVGTSLKELELELVFKLFDRDRERGLRDKTRVCRAPKMPLSGHRHNVFQLGQGHANPLWW